MEFVNAERDRAARICQIEHRRAEDDSVQHRMTPSVSRYLRERRAER